MSPVSPPPSRTKPAAAKPGLDLRTIAGRLRHARIAAGFETAADAARALALPAVTVRSNENGSQPAGRDRLEQYARRYKVDFAWLATGRGAMRARVLEVLAVAGVGGEVFGVAPETVAPHLVPMPAGLDDDVGEAIEIRYRDAWPRWGEGDVIVTRGPRPPGELVGRHCLVTLSDGRRYLRRLEAGARGLYTLESPGGAIAPMRGVRIAAAAPVGWAIYL